MKEEKIIQNFLDEFPSKNTKKNYRKALNDYFSVNKVKDPNNYFTTDRNYKADVKNYCQSLLGKAPWTFIVRIAGVKSFYDWYAEENNLDDMFFPKTVVKKFRARNKMKSIKPIVKDKIFKRSELKTILTHADIRSRALFLTMASSGLREDEVLQLLPDDIIFENDPVMIDVRKEIAKNGEQRYTFISNESANSINEWLKIKDKYLKKYAHCIQNIPEMKNIKKSDVNERIFPFSLNAAWKMLQKLLHDSDKLKKVKNLKNVTRYEFHLHTFRKFFRTNLAVEMSVDMIEQMMGHEGYLTGAYRDYDSETLGEHYKNAVHQVTILESTPDLTGITSELDDVRKENIQMKQEMQERKMEILELRLTLQELKNKKK